MYISQVSGERLQDHWSSGLSTCNDFEQPSGKHVREMGTPSNPTFI